MMRHRRFCATALGAVHIVEAGPRDAPDVVLLHQTPRSSDEYAEVVDILGVDHHVIAIDTIGYGCSDHVFTQPTIADYAEGVVRVLQQIGVSRATLVGHHTGAFIALEVAAIAPDCVTGVLLSGPVFMDDETRPRYAPWFVQWHPDAEGTHLHDKWSRLGRWAAEPAMRQRLLADVFRAGETSEQGHAAILAYQMAERLPLVHAPALLLYADADPFVDITQVSRFAQLLRHTAVEQTDGGIFLPTERPEAFSDIVRRFVDTLGIRARALAIAPDTS